MKRMLLFATILLPLVAPAAAVLDPAVSGNRPSRNEQMLADYFRVQTSALEKRCLADIRSLEDWQGRREEYRRQLQEMLGLWPMPERTELKPVITGKLEEAEFTVEKLHFQALPRLYVTANLYLPKKLEQPAPTILYVCGHSRVFTNGVSCGNKTAYQRHGAWFARNGYVCLVIDTLQYGEIEGHHRGTYRNGQWWWNSRGYTPAGVEAWFGLRALDYLCSRPEVDKERIGMTGRSGGGSYTWTVAALDERVKVAAPIAGMTDLRNQVVDGSIEGHCDCMFFPNTYRWDFGQVAALLAPRPLLIGNSDKDPLFPLDGVVRLYQQTRRIYQLYGKTNQLGLLITEGPHADTQELQLPVFRWFNRFLKHQDTLIEMAARDFFSREQLRAFEKLPEDQLNTTIEQSFVPKAVPPGPSDSPAERQQRQAQYLDALRAKVFAGWPAESTAVKLEPGTTSTYPGLRYQEYAFESQPEVSLRLLVLQQAKVKKPGKVLLTVLDAESWTNSPVSFLWLGGGTDYAVGALRQEMQMKKWALAFLAPRGVEPSKGLSEPKTADQIRRRYMLLGQTLDSMRVWDIRRAARALKALPEFRQTRLEVCANGEMGVNAAYAALFESAIAKLKLEGLPASQAEGPDYLNVLKVWDLPQLWDLLGERAERGPRMATY